MQHIVHDYGKAELAYKEFIKPSLQQALESLKIEPHYKILDAGCGPGALLPFFAAKLNSDGLIIGLDASESHLELAKQTVESNNLQNSVQLTLSDLFEDLLFENNFFDLIWISDVLFPDGFGDEILVIIQKLKSKLKHGGKIAIFYSNWLRMQLLPGYTILEHFISIANEKRRSKTYNWFPNLHPECAIDWLYNAGFANCKNNYFTTQYSWPLPENIESYIYYHLVNIYGKAIEYQSGDFKVPHGWASEFYDITNPGSPDFILRKKNYHCAVHAQLTIGEKR
jgi:SAM-dependent methyltransferase